MTSDFISMLTLRSDDIEDPLIHNMEKRGVYIGEGYYAIMLFSPYSLSDSILNTGSNISIYNIQKLIDQELYGHELYYQTLFSGHCVCLLCYPHIQSAEDADMRAADLEKYAANIQNEYAKSGGRVTVIISTFANNLASLKHAFRYCLEAYDYFKFMEQIPDIYSALFDKAHGLALTQFQEMKTITQLANRFVVAVCSGKSTEFRFLLPDIYGAILTPDANSLRKVHYRIFVFINQLLLSLNERDIVDKSFLLNHSIFQQMIGAETTAQMKDILQQFVQDVYSETMKKRNLRTPLKSNQAESVKKYIDNNFTDPTLDVCELSRAFNISQPLLSSSFKRTFGTSPSEYIRTKRLDLAKDYLKNSEKAVSEICILTGFGSLSSIQRSFYQLVGMTPGRFRMQCRLENENTLKQTGVI